MGLTCNSQSLIPVTQKVVNIIGLIYSYKTVNITQAIQSQQPSLLYMLHQVQVRDGEGRKFETLKQEYRLKNGNFIGEPLINRQSLLNIPKHTLPLCLTLTPNPLV